MAKVFNIGDQVKVEWRTGEWFDATIIKVDNLNTLLIQLIFIFEGKAKRDIAGMLVPRALQRMEQKVRRNDPHRHHPRPRRIAS